MARMKYSQELSPSIRVQRDEDLISHTARTVLIVLAIVGTMAILGWLWFSGMVVGYRLESVEPAVAVVQAVVQQPVVLPQPTTPSTSGEAEEVGIEPLPKPKPKSLWDINP